MKFQIGKNGISEGVIETLNIMFRTNKTIRVSVLKNSGRDKDKMKEMADELCSRLLDKYKSEIKINKIKNKGVVFRYKIIGFVILLKKFTGVKRETL